MLQPISKEICFGNDMDIGVELSEIIEEKTNFYPEIIPDFNNSLDNTNEQKKTNDNTYINNIYNINDNLKQDLNASDLFTNKNISDASTIKKRKKHTKYDVDNLIRNLKSLIFKYLREYINEEIIKKVLKRKIKENKKQSIFINKGGQNSNSTKKYNRALLKRTLGDILSFDVTRRSKVSPDHNKKLINDLKNFEETEIKEFFYNLFNLTFKDCLEHFRGTKNNEYLEGMKKFDEIKNKFEKDEKYLKGITNLLMNFDKKFE